MTPQRAPFVLALIAAGLAAGFALLMRLPLPFEGCAMLAAALLAALATLSLLALAPVRWLWTDADLLARAFRLRHDLSDLGARNALAAITKAHDQALALRRAATHMQPQMSELVEEAAGRLDAAARTLFYAPDQLRALQPVLSRAELIVEAAEAHAALRRAPERPGSPQQDASRKALRAATSALTEAFMATEARAAQGLLEKVETASEIAETLLSGRTSKAD